MAVYDKHFGGYRIFVGDLGRQATRFDVERQFEPYGQLLDVWVARNPPGFAFLVFKNSEDCERAVRRCHGRKVCGRRVRVEFARPFDDRGGKPYSRHRSRTRSRSRNRKRSYSRDRKRRSCHRQSRSRSESKSRQSSRHSRERYVTRSRSRGVIKSESPKPSHEDNSSSNGHSPQRSPSNEKFRQSPISVKLENGQDTEGSRDGD